MKLYVESGKIFEHSDYTFPSATLMIESAHLRHNATVYVVCPTQACFAKASDGKRVVAQVF